MAREFLNGITVIGNIEVEGSEPGISIDVSALGLAPYGGIDFLVGADTGSILYYPADPSMKFFVANTQVLQLVEGAVTIDGTLAAGNIDSVGEVKVISATGSRATARMYTQYGGAGTDRLYVEMSDDSPDPAFIYFGFPGNTQVLAVEAASGGDVKVLGRSVATVASVGSWTPSIQASSSVPSVTYNRQGGYYMRIGRLVWFTGRIDVNTISGGGGSLQIGGLPFNITSDENDRPSIPIVTSGVDWPGFSTFTSLWITGSVGANRFSVLSQQDNGAFTAVSISAVAAGDTFWFTGHYWTDDS